ncbi:MAG TPA: PilZ domain-containing protein [Phycisphaerae bacterium]|nr:PilZ domain-containing protein [Phycisphaerae bacterium]
MSSLADKAHGTPEHERRRYPRRIVPMHVVAVVNDESGQGSSRVLHVQVKDISRGGICGVVDNELAGNEQVVVFLPVGDAGAGRDVRGRLTRCEPVESRFRIGMAFLGPMEGAGGQAF